jgi:hypothetical protein
MGPEIKTRLDLAGYNIWLIALFEILLIEDNYKLKQYNPPIL